MSSGVDILLDTHMVIWLLDDPERVPPVVRAAVEGADSTASISAASWFEMAVKVATGKLKLKLETAHARMRRLGVLDLPIRVDHAIELAKLPLHHRDPFDRLLVAQARVEEMTLVTVDRQLADYDVPIIGLE